MRPKKKILLLADDPGPLAQWKTILRVQGFRSIESLIADADLEQARDCDAIFVVLSGAKSTVDFSVAGFFDRLQNATQPYSWSSPRICCRTLGPIAGLTEEVTTKLAHCGMAFRPYPAFSHADVLDTLRTLAARKRGPRKGSVRAKPAPDFQPAAIAS